MAKMLPRFVSPRLPARPVAPPVSDPFAPPIALYGEAVVGAGSDAEVPTGAISNNTGRPIEIREIRLSADSSDTTTNYSNPAGALRTTIAINDKPVTATAMPLWSLGRLENPVAQTLQALGSRPAAQYVWRLSRPCLLPPGTAVSVKFSNAGIVPFTITGRVCLVGRFSDAAAKLAAVPYALFWASRPYGIEAATDYSPERTLTNTLARTLHVDRIIARHAVLSSGTAAAPADATLTFADGHGAIWVPRNAVAPALGLLRLRLATSRNQIVIPDFAPIWDTFGLTGSIDIPHTLAPRDFYRAAARYYTADPDLGLAPSWAGTPPSTYQHSLHLSFVGWREEAL